MANTERLGLYKVPSDPAEQETTNFNTETMLNDNWNTLDEKVAMVDENGKVINKDGTPAGGVSEQEFTQLETKVDEHQAEGATDAHNISNITGLQSALDGKQSTLPPEQKRNIYISAAAPENPSENDIWIEIDPEEPTP